MEGEPSVLLRRGVLFGVPLLYLVHGLLHPTSNPELGDETGLLGHARPMGPIGMGLFLAGIAWLELRPRREEARQAASLQRP
jgi:hypothetical protein